MDHVSPSQIATWLDCPWKWSESRRRPRPPPNRWAEFGLTAHKILAQWLTHGVSPDPLTPEGACAIAGLPFLPLPGTGLVEQPFRFLAGGVTYVGVADLVFGLVENEQVTVLDHKTTGNLEYRKIPEHIDPSLDLTWDPQWIIYAFWAMSTFAVPRVNGVWLYYLRKPPKAVPSVYSAGYDEICRRFWALHENVVLRMSHDDPPRSLRACNKYGRCPYRTECHQDLSPLTLATAALEPT